MKRAIYEVDPPEVIVTMLVGLSLPSAMEFPFDGFSSISGRPPYSFRWNTVDGEWWQHSQAYFNPSERLFNSQEMLGSSYPEFLTALASSKLQNPLALIDFCTSDDVDFTFSSSFRLRQHSSIEHHHSLRHVAEARRLYQQPALQISLLILCFLVFFPAPTQ